VEVLFDRPCEQWRESIPRRVLATRIAHQIMTSSYQLQKAMKKPHHEKKNTLPY
jgi:hypothetical protein